jgi:hypothetical protein
MARILAATMRFETFVFLTYRPREPSVCWCPDYDVVITVHLDGRNAVNRFALCRRTHGRTSTHTTHITTPRDVLHVLQKRPTEAAGGKDSCA